MKGVRWLCEQAVNPDLKLEDLGITFDPGNPAMAKLANWLFSGGGDESAKIRTAREVFGRLFLPSPPLRGPEGAQREAFDALIDGFRSSNELDLQYDCPYPKWEFLRHLTSSYDYLLHGSGVALSELMPRPQDDWSGRPTNAVFATSDPIWSIFFATIDRAVANRGIRNGGLMIATTPRTSERYYFFSVEESGTARQMLRPGYVHLLKREGFETSSAPVRFDEWHRNEPAQVVKRLAVSIEDFPFHSSIAVHPAEPTPASWLNYRKRISAT